MSQGDNRETEVKFHVRDLSRVEERLRGLNARLVQARIHEVNIRFDTKERELLKEGRVLRLRQDDAARMTYKSASERRQGILSREEIEFTVGDFQKARQFLEALGFEKMFFYEKYRAVYELGCTHVMLDELPYGAFVEIEGESDSDIRETAATLNLKWDAAVAGGYHALFERLRVAKGFGFDELSFENFAGKKITEQDLNVRAAD